MDLGVPFAPPPAPAVRVPPTAMVARATVTVMFGLCEEPVFVVALWLLVLGPGAPPALVLVALPEPPPCIVPLVGGCEVFEDGPVLDELPPPVPEAVPVPPGDVALDPSPCPEPFRWLDPLSWPDDGSVVVGATVVAVVLVADGSDEETGWFGSAINKLPVPLGAAVVVEVVVEVPGGAPRLGVVSFSDVAVAAVVVVAWLVPSWAEMTVEVLPAGAPGPDLWRLRVCAAASTAAGRDAEFTSTGAGAATAATVLSALASATVRPSPTAAAGLTAIGAVHPRNGTWAIQDSGPITRRIRPRETLSMARTTLGSKWVPAQRLSSRRASADDIGFL